MGRPKQKTRDKVIRWLKENPNQKITYLELAKRTSSHPMAIGQILKSIAKISDLKDLTKMVVRTKPPVDEADSK